MKKKIILCIVIILFVILLIPASQILKNSYIKTIKNQNNASNKNKIETVTSVELNKEQLINTSTDIKINGTNDSFIINVDEVGNSPELEKGETISSSYIIPYQITVDGNTYNGIYWLGDSSFTEGDNNPKYNLKVLSPPSDGLISIIISQK